MAIRMGEIACSGQEIDSRMGAMGCFIGEISYCFEEITCDPWEIHFYR